MEKNSKEIQKKLTTVKYNCADSSHLSVNQEICAKCKEKTCTFICPADVYIQDENTGQLVVQYENCLECGACKIACPKKNIEWRYPSAGCGVVFKNS
ncbi:MAG: 4Fe-4S dicluster domain-containing protein [Candidatus Gastranaerophilales bacterium]|nr:4Fe-4S dicluster domain-containing protein [Candidatus Gastranaerophilales bacterium]